VFNGDVPKFPLYWMRAPTRYQLSPRSIFSTEDFLGLGILEQLPRRISTRRLLGCYSIDDKAIVVVGMFFHYTMVVYFHNLIILLLLIS